MGQVQQRLCHARCAFRRNFADDLDKVVDQAAYSSVVTHSHPEAVAGAIAVAAAAALAWQHEVIPPTLTEFLQKIIQLTPVSGVHLGIKRAFNLPPDSTVADAARAPGNGARVSCQDTVPFCLWAAARHLDDYQDALWTTVSGLGDRDTTCAIVGGIVAMSAGMRKTPPGLGSNPANRFPPGFSIRHPPETSVQPDPSATMLAEASWASSFSV
jgi:ADP-ribosylglycohydrolase